VNKGKSKNRLIALHLKRTLLRFFFWLFSMEPVNHAPS